MPITVEEYRIAQIYMTARTQALEAEQSDGAGVEILENTPMQQPPAGTPANFSPAMGEGVYTRKHYHIDRRFPPWLKAIAPKSGCTLVEHAYNSYPWTRTEVRLPLFAKFLMIIESKHANDRGDTHNIHNLTPQQLKKREVVYIDIGETIETDKKKKMYEQDDADPRTFVSKRTGRGGLLPGWQKTCQPVMCAYKLVTAEFDYWPLSGTIEPFMHTYERGIFLNANRSMFCWIDEWHGLTTEDVKVYEDEVAKRTNLITAIRERRATGRIEDIPPVVAVRSSDRIPAPASSGQHKTPTGSPQVVGTANDAGRTPLIGSDARSAPTIPTAQATPPSTTAESASRSPLGNKDQTCKTLLASQEKPPPLPHRLGNRRDDGALGGDERLNQTAQRNSRTGVRPVAQMQPERNGEHDGHDHHEDRRRLEWPEATEPAHFDAVSNTMHPAQRPAPPHILSEASKTAPPPALAVASPQTGAGAPQTPHSWLPFSLPQVPLSPSPMPPMPWENGGALPVKMDRAKQRDPRPGEPVCGNPVSRPRAVFRRDACVNACGVGCCGGMMRWHSFRGGLLRFVCAASFVWHNVLN